MKVSVPFCAGPSQMPRLKTTFKPCGGPRFRRLGRSACVRAAPSSRRAASQYRVLWRFRSPRMRRARPRLALRGRAPSVAGPGSLGGHYLHLQPSECHLPPRSDDPWQSSRFIHGHPGLESCACRTVGTAALPGSAILFISCSTHNPVLRTRLPEVDTPCCATASSAS
jgi:hypothetical protein